MTLGFNVWYPRDDFSAAEAFCNGAPRIGLGLIGLEFRQPLFPGGPSRNLGAFSHQAGGTTGDDTIVGWNASGIYAAEFYPDPRRTVRTWPMPSPTLAGVEFRFTISGLVYSKSISSSPPVARPAARTAPTSPTTPPAATPPTTPTPAPVTPAVTTYTWPEVREAAKAGLFVRRLSWPASRTLTFIAGAGTTRAVAIIEESGVRRTVQAADFAPAEFLGTDWVFVFQRADLPGIGGSVPVPSTPTPSTPPPAGQFVQVWTNGVPAFVPLAPFECPG